MICNKQNHWMLKDFRAQIDKDKKHVPLVQGIFSSSAGGSRHPWQKPQVARHTFDAIRQPCVLVVFHIRQTNGCQISRQPVNQIWLGEEGALSSTKKKKGEVKWRFAVISTIEKKFVSPAMQRSLPPHSLLWSPFPLAKLISSKNSKDLQLLGDPPPDLRLWCSPQLSPLPHPWRKSWLRACSLHRLMTQNSEINMCLNK